MPINIDITLKSSKWLKHKTFFNKVLKNRINDILLHFPNLVDKEIELSIVVANNRIVGNLNKYLKRVITTFPIYIILSFILYLYNKKKNTGMNNIYHYIIFQY